MNKKRAAILALALSVALPAAAQTSAPQELTILQTAAHYISGQPGFKKEMWQGHMILGPDVLSFTEQRANSPFTTKQVPRFSIPLTTIAAATNTIDTNGPNATAVALAGAWALSSKRQDEYVFITTETETTTDVVIFQVKKNTSAATAAKIAFAAKKAKERAPHD